MAAVRKAVAAALTLAAAAGIGGCGRSAPEKVDKAGKRAQYALQANLFCESLRTELVPPSRPGTHALLTRYLGRTDEAMRTAAAGLHDARHRLGSEATPQMRSFDRRIDSVAGVTKRLSDEAVKLGPSPRREGQRVLIDRAEQARRAFAVLRRSAQAAGLRRCGLEGDDLAEAVLFTTYRGQYLRIQGATFRSLQRAPFRPSDSLARYLRTARRYLNIRRAEYRRVRRLIPPARLHAAHAVLVKRFADALSADVLLQSALDRGELRAISVATARLQRQDGRYFSAERKLRQLLDQPAAP